ncbi:MAG: MobV family relaxase [bacterium]
MSEVSGYAILRMVKHKSFGSVAAMSAHSLRERPVANADPAAPKPLTGGAKTTAELLKRLKAGIALAKKKGGRQGFTKASSPVLEFLVTSGHEKMMALSLKEQNEYFKNAGKFLASEFGGQENILSWSIHRDERTPHMQIFVMPLDRTTNRFSASKFIGGPPGMIARLDRFAEEVGKPFGMIRGDKESRAEHVPIGQFYGALAAGAEVPKDIEVPPSPSMSDRLNPEVFSAKQKAREDAKKARKAQEELLKKQAKVGRSVHPKIVAAMAEKYKKNKNLEALLKKQEAEIRALKNDVSTRQKDADDRMRIALDHENETRLLAQTADHVFMDSAGAKMLDQMSRAMDPKIVEKLAKAFGVQLVPGRGLLDQLRKAGKGANMIETARLLTARLEILNDHGTPVNAPKHQERPKG